MVCNVLTDFDQKDISAIKSDQEANPYRPLSKKFTKPLTADSSQSKCFQSRWTHCAPPPPSPSLPVQVDTGHHPHLINFGDEGLMVAKDKQPSILPRGALSFNLWYPEYGRDSTWRISKTSPVLVLLLHSVRRPYMWERECMLEFAMSCSLKSRNTTLHCS